MADTIKIGTLTFVVAPEEVPEPKPAPKPKLKPQPSRTPAPQCSPSRHRTMPPMKKSPDGYYRMGYIADRMWQEHNKPRWKKALGL